MQPTADPFRLAVLATHPLYRGGQGRYGIHFCVTGAAWRSAKAPFLGGQPLYNEDAMIIKPKNRALGAKGKHTNRAGAR